MTQAIDPAMILARAYVPEHIVGLMTHISKAKPFLIEDYLGFGKDNWLILVGYPLAREFTREACEGVIARARDLYRPEYLWFIGPEVPPSLAALCRERQSDEYFQIEVARAPARLQRIAERAARVLRLERAREFTRQHQSLTAEFLRRQPLPPMIAELYRAMPDYVAHTPSACVLNAWDARGKLSAFYVLELAAEQFDTYVLGCYSREHYIAHASDALFWEMLALARERGKPIVNLGLGVNAGIRRFKTKWGGVPYLRYEFCECHFAKPRSAADLLIELPR